MKQKNAINYEKAAALIAQLLRGKVGPMILALRKKKKIKISTKKTYADIVTAGDKVSEKIIRRHIGAKYPEHKIYGEEGADKNTAELKFEWFIDPIDGTIPYASGGENFGICVGLVERNVPRMGIIFYPAKNKLLSAIRGRGAFLNGIPVKNRRKMVDLNNAVLALGIPAGPGSGVYIDKYVKPLIANIRSAVFSGSYSADVLQLIEGSVDGAILANATAYDAAATMIIAKEAGFATGTINGDKIDFRKRKMLVIYSATEKLQRQLTALLR